MKTGIKVFCFLILAALAACGQPLPPAVIPPEVQPFVDTHMEYAPNLTDGLEVEFDDLDVRTAGLCTRYSTGRMEVKLDRKMWAGLDRGERQALITHELGHCLEHMDHRGETRDGVYTSFMYPYLLTSKMYEAKRRFYEAEFKSRHWEGN